MMKLHDMIEAWRGAYDARVTGPSRSFSHAGDLTRPWQQHTAGGTLPLAEGETVEHLLGLGRRHPAAPCVPTQISTHSWAMEG